MSDYRGYCQPIQDQGNCGGCTAYGTVGITELRDFLKYGVLKKYSETDLFACSGGTCSQGNTMEATFARAMRGIPLEVCRPTVNVDTRCGEGRCEEWWINAIKILNPRKLTTKEEIDEAIDSGGVVATLEVHESFTHITEGIYTGPTGSFDPLLGYHCIGIVGRTEDGADLLRNSWNLDWGEGGYCWIKRGVSELEYYVFDVSDEVEADEPDEEPVIPSILPIIFIIVIAVFAFLIWLFGGR